MERKTQGLDFGEALKELRNGELVQREGWNGTVIKPTVGRVVWFREPEHTRLTLAAIIAHVHNDALVNLAVFDQNGNAHARTSIPLVQDGEPTPQLGPYCCWMPYQLGQAARESRVSPEVKPQRVPAYELPEMRADDPGLITDGVTHNLDGSIWRLKPPREGGGPIKIIHGYISEVKHPGLWELARALYKADFEQRFAQPVRARPYMIYTGNPEVFIKRGYAMPGQGRETTKKLDDPPEVNFMMFTAALQPTGMELVP